MCSRVFKMKSENQGFIEKIKKELGIFIDTKRQKKCDESCFLFESLQ